MPGRRSQRDAGVKADVRVAGDEWVVAEAGVQRGVGNEEHVLVAGNGVGAEGHVPTGAADVETAVAAEELAVTPHD